MATRTPPRPDARAHACFAAVALLASSALLGCATSTPRSRFAKRYAHCFGTKACLRASGVPGRDFPLVPRRYFYWLGPGPALTTKPFVPVTRGDKGGWPIPDSPPPVAPPRATKPPPEMNVPFFDGRISEAEELDLRMRYGLPLATTLYAEVDQLLGKEFDATVAKNTRAQEPALRGRVIEVAELEADRTNRALTQGCESIVSAHALNDETRAIELTAKLWDDLHAEYAALRPRAFEAVADVIVPLLAPDASRLETLYREIRYVSGSADVERLARRGLAAYLRSRVGTIANQILAPHVDGALAAARNREILVLSKCAPRIEPTASTAKPAKGAASAGDEPR